MILLLVKTFDCSGIIHQSDNDLAVLSAAAGVDKDQVATSSAGTGK